MPTKRRTLQKSRSGSRRSVDADDYRDEDEDEEKPRRRSVARRGSSSTRSRPNSKSNGRRSISRKSRDDDDDEEEEERSSRRRVSSSRSNKRSTRRSDDEDDEERPSRKGRGSKSSTPVRTGWGGAKETRAKSGGFAEDLEVDKNEKLIKFLEDEPFANYRQHWAEWRTSGKRSFICIEDDCPLCDIGDRPNAQFLFNVVDLSDEPINKCLRVGVQALGQIENLSTGKNGPLTKHYWAVSKSKSKGRGNTVAWNFNPVKERDLEEDWEMEPLTDDELDELLESAYQPDVVQLSTRKQLKEIAAEAMDDEDDGDGYDD